MTLLDNILDGTVLIVENRNLVTRDRTDTTRRTVHHDNVTDLDVVGRDNEEAVIADIQGEIAVVDQTIALHVIALVSTTLSANGNLAVHGQSAHICADLAEHTVEHIGHSTKHTVKIHNLSPLFFVRFCSVFRHPYYITFNR